MYTGIDESDVLAFEEFYSRPDDEGTDLVNDTSSSDLLTVAKGPDQPSSLTYEKDDNKNWVDVASCAQVDTEVFYPRHVEYIKAAKRICAGCVVVKDCLDYAIKHDERHGVWGGLSANERSKLRARQSR